MKGNTQTTRIGRITTLLGTASLLAAGWSVPGLAQETAPPTTAEPPTTAPETTTERPQGEIIVLARKRAESILKVPVVVTAVSNETLEAAGVTEITDLPKTISGKIRRTELSRAEKQRRAGSDRVGHDPRREEDSGEQEHERHLAPAPADRVRHNSLHPSRSQQAPGSEQQARSFGSSAALALLAGGGARSFASRRSRRLAVSRPTFEGVIGRWHARV